MAASRNPPRASGTADGGVGITGCVTGACTLAVPWVTAPVLYQAGSAARWTHGRAAAGGGGDHRPGVAAVAGRHGNARRLGPAPLDVTPAQAKLLNTSLFWPSDTIGAALVTSGQLVAALPVPVGRS